VFFYIVVAVGGFLWSLGTFTKNTSENDQPTPLEQSIRVSWKPRKSKSSVPVTVVRSSWEWVTSESSIDGDSPTSVRPVLRFFIELDLPGIAPEEIQKLNTSRLDLQIVQSELLETGRALLGVDLTSVKSETTVFLDRKNLGKLAVEVSPAPQKVRVWRACPSYEFGYRRPARERPFLYVGVHCREEKSGLWIELIPSEEKGAKPQLIELQHATRQIINVADKIPSHPLVIGLRKKLSPRYGIEVGWDTVFTNYKEGTRHEITMASLATRFGYTRDLDPNWSLRSMLSATIFPIAQNVQNLDIHFVNGTLAAVYQRPLDEQWSLGGLVGLYYVSMFTRRATFGYRHQLGPQLAPHLRVQIGEDDDLTFGGRVAAVADRGFKLMEISNNELGGSFGWRRLLSDKTRVGISLAYTRLELKIKTTQLKSNHFAIQTAFEF